MAEPTWPTSVRSSVRWAGTRSSSAMAPVASGSAATAWAVAATSRSGRSWRRTTTVPMPAAASTASSASNVSVRISELRVSSTSLVGSPVTSVAGSPEPSRPASATTR